MMLPVSPRAMLIATLQRNGVGAEIGVYEGDFSDDLLRGAKPATLHLIDPWFCSDAPEHAPAWYGTERSTQAEMDKIYAGVQARFKRHITRGRVVVHRATSEQALRDIPNNSLDWIYIDGDHTYNGAILDLRMSLSKVKRGGMICGNDYALGHWWQDGVVRAVHEFLQENNATLALKLVMGTEFAIEHVGARPVAAPRPRPPVSPAPAC